MDKVNSKIKVGCAMSGGVDSAVAAGLLKDAGFEVIGIFARLLGGKNEDKARVAAVCEKLKIPFRAVDLRAEFRKRIVEKFLQNTKKGLTPNPCVFCNQEIKFGLLMDAALKFGTDYFATGHYCRIKKTKDGIHHLLKGKDKEKDQSYFLWRLKQKQLEKIIFPLGIFEKSEVKDLVKFWNLPVKNNSESQNVCFTCGDTANFLQQHLGKNPGDIIGAESKKIVGQHDGLWVYTIGQRKGIGLSSGPFYVVGKNFAKNRLIVSKNLPVGNIVKLTDVNWISAAAPNLPIKIKAKIRYRSKAAAAVLDRIGKDHILQFATPQFAPTPGQSAVFYDRGEIIGGGAIKS